MLKEVDKPLLPVNFQEQSLAYNILYSCGIPQENAKSCTSMKVQDPKIKKRKKKKDTKKERGEREEHGGPQLLT
jgi:hypothetical protein